MSYVVLPEFLVEAQNLDAFLKAARDDAECSVAKSRDVGNLTSLSTTNHRQSK
tara:strand:+ start:862 stop:1020 length:159 start_codon:yes stop_codon:yes gene_type:complete